MKILVTGAAGFIGSALALRLLERGDEVIGVDNLNPYYDVALKEARLDRLRTHAGFREVRLDVADRPAVAELFGAERPTAVVHLAAQAGVRYSIDHPEAYISSNLVGFANILEGCRHSGVQHLAYASSSSVYGANTRLPFSVDDPVNHPISLYAATKKANELMAHTYSHLYGLPTTGLRFFTVYGPWGRPDMALFKFTRAILAGEPIDVYNHGQMQRDFTYIDDIVECVTRIVDRPAVPDPAWNSDDPVPGTSRAPYRLYNVGNHQPVELLHLIRVLEAALGRRAELRLLPLQPGDVLATFADVEGLVQEFGVQPATPIEVGIERFVAWYRDFYAAPEAR
ncbi:NAD-dependent epimerase [Deinococcus sp. SDU3-2]|uniref:NAD-dependent epimerase n=1 Tax=Deinococcus terrestris TaxID=2651870 RepID=A0A7X1TS99_9DEIO|nr:NAD-dependent epimerase [Deinococcus terrestris]MPY67618.1 NAD-dependent epimerase [Deinococcus terrestris]